MRVHLATIHDRDPWFRQTPNNDGVWEDCVYVLNDPHGTADWLVVVDQPPAGLSTRVPWERRILFVTEPPECVRYPLYYRNQFGIIVGGVNYDDYRGRLLKQQSALPWHYGIDRWDVSRQPMLWRELAASKDKSKVLSVICSDKQSTPQQRLRFAFVKRLQQRLGGRVDVFGKNVVDFADKADVISPYRYHIVLENNTIDHFWTEKLADAFLGDSYPIFAGCRNAGEYFDPNSFSSIDVANADKAIDKIEEIIRLDKWTECIDAVRDSRRRVMHEHNIFACVRRIIETVGCDVNLQKRLSPEIIIPQKRPTKIVRQVKKWRAKLSAALAH